MFTNIVEISATKQEFRFSQGRKESRFRPVAYLSAEGKVLSLGSAPVQGGADREVHLFEGGGSTDAFAVLEAMMRYGLRDVSGRLRIGPLRVEISIGADICQDLRGFAPAVFHYAAMNAGATKVVIR
jgi:hypothetical protein